MLAHPKIDPTGSATGRTTGPLTVSRTTTTRPAKASGSRYVTARQTLLEGRVGGLPGVGGAGRSSGRTRSASRAGSCSPMTLDPPVAVWLGAEQRIQVRIEPDRASPGPRR